MASTLARLRNTAGKGEDASLNEAFWRYFQKIHWFQNTVAAVIGIFIYSLFGVVDYLVMDGAVSALWRIRFGVTLPLLVATLTLQFIPPLGRPLAGPIIFIAMLLGGGSIVLMNLYMPETAHNLYFTGLLLVMIFGHVFWRAHYLWPFSASSLIFAFYLWLMLGRGHITDDQLVASVFYYISSLFIMTYTGWFIVRQERRSFLLQQELQQAAATDSLTGIANRRAFFLHLEREWRRAHRQGEGICLLVVDLDNMKEINDSGGHASGDAALKQVAEALSRHARRPGDLAARLGGDEFVLILAGSKGEAACEVAEALVEEMKGAGNGVTVSIGAACVSPASESGQERLLRLADQALYEAKRQGRSRAVCRHLSVEGKDQISA